MWKGVGERWGGLNCRKWYLASIGTFWKTENSLGLVVCDLLLDLYNVLVHCSNIVKITKNKRQLWIESAGDDILGVFLTPFLILFERYFISVFFSVEVLLVFCQLDHHWYLKHILQIFRKDKGQQMPTMHDFTGWTPTCVEIKRLSFLILI